MTRIEYMIFFMARLVSRQEIAGLYQKLGRFPAGTGASPRDADLVIPALHAPSTVSWPTAFAGRVRGRDPRASCVS